MAVPDLDERYRKLQPSLLRYLRLAHAAEAEDIAADVWLEVAALTPRFIGGDDAFRGWVFTLARRRVIDAYRRDARRRTEPLDIEIHDAAAREPEEEAVTRIAAEHAIARVHDLLTPDQAEVILLRVVGGLTVERVARITGKQPVNVRVLQYRALRRLATRLQAG